MAQTDSADRRRERAAKAALTQAPPPEVVPVTTDRVACDGDGGALGHPRVWLQIDRDTGYVECGYCDRRFVLKAQ